MSGIIGKKIGMTSIYDENGKNIPCTILQAGPCTIIQVKTEDKDGYSSFQLGFDEKTKNTTKAYEGQFKKSKSNPMSKLVEFKGFEGDLKLGDKITLMSPSGVETIIGSMPKQKTFEITSIFNSGLAD